MEGNANMHAYKAKRFVEHCRVKFNWRDLSSDVIMDVGCGEKGNCGKAILEKFPDVKSVIGIDSDPEEIRNFKLKAAGKMESVVADIEKWETLQNYAGKMDKVISTCVFHLLKEKEEAFRNVYNLLKPGGEAAVVFIKKSLLYEWLTELLKNPKWKKAYKKQSVENKFKGEFGANHYREMVEKMGFQVVDCEEGVAVIPFSSDQVCKDVIYEFSEDYFKINSGDLEEFKDDCFQVFLKLSARNNDGKPCYRVAELVLLLTKPTEGVSCKTKE